MKRYCIWNNKGGVGKSFLTYILSTEYALLNPDKEVIVIDMCPQGNVSEILLGGNGTGQSHLEEMHDNGTTIAEYIKKVYLNGRENIIKHAQSFFIQVCTKNEKIPENLYLLPGDIDLDICSGIITHMGSAPTKNSWANSRLILNDLLDKFTNNEGKEQVFFIDCNPSFATYTELALLSSDQLIIPCTADNASLRGLLNVFQILYAPTIDDELFTQFKEHVNQANLPLPKIHSVLLNKSRSHEKKAAKAFSASINKLEETLEQMKRKFEPNFTDSFTGVTNIKDGNTLATIINHTGYLLSTVSQGYYPIYEEQVQLNQTQLESFREDIQTAVALL